MWSSCESLSSEVSSLEVLLLWLSFLLTSRECVIWGEGACEVGGLMYCSCRLYCPVA
jgi:hypothetical protein